MGYLELTRKDVTDSSETDHRRLYAAGFTPNYNSKVFQIHRACPRK